MSNFDFTAFNGNLVDDPSRGNTRNTTVANMCVAKSRGWTDKESGEKKKATDFIDVEIWDHQAERCLAEFHKGDRVVVVGSLRTDSWDADDGTKRSKLYVRASSVTLSLEF